MSTPSPLSADRLRADVADLLGCAPAEIPADADLTEFGLDSMRMMDLVEKWRAAGVASVEFADLAEDPRLARWTSMLAGERT